MLSETTKNKVLNTLAQHIDESRSNILKANMADLDAAENLDPTLFDRLKVEESKINGMIKAIQEVRAKTDPVGKILYSYNHPNGMHVENRVVPFGRILIIYESRPDVTIEAAISAFKSGNQILLKGGKEAHNTNQVLVELWREALEKHDVSTDQVQYLKLKRTETQQLLSENTHDLDLIIPRGGEGLINFIKSNSSVPVIVSGRGNNFLFVDREADFEMAIDLILNGKSRLSVCNAIDKVLIDQDLPDLQQKVSTLVQTLHNMDLTVYSDVDDIIAISNVEPMTDESMYDEEFLAPKIFLTLSSGLHQAIDIINTHSGGHSAVIVSENTIHGRVFMEQVDAAAVYHNVSSRFTDGGQFGLGAEMAISTQKLHFRGPVGMSELVTNKWFVTGDGQTR